MLEVAQIDGYNAYLLQKAQQEAEGE
jgi:hypothetical protein